MIFSVPLRERTRPQDRANLLHPSSCRKYDGQATRGEANSKLGQPFVLLFRERSYARRGYSSLCSFALIPQENVLSALTFWGDESGSHNRADVTFVLSGYLGADDTWE